MEFSEVNDQYILRDHCEYDEEVHDYLFVGEYEKLNNLDGIEDRKQRYKRRDEERAERRRKEEEENTRRRSAGELEPVQDSNTRLRSSWISSLINRYSDSDLDGSVSQLYSEIVNSININTQLGESPYGTYTGGTYTINDEPTPEPSEPEL
jgi:hypothetical protein